MNIELTEMQLETIRDFFYCWENESGGFSVDISVKEYDDLLKKLNIPNDDLKTE